MVAGFSQVFTVAFARLWRFRDVSGQIFEVSCLIQVLEGYCSMLPGILNDDVRIRYPIYNYMYMPGSFCTYFDICHPPHFLPGFFIFFSHLPHGLRQMLFCSLHIRWTLILFVCEQYQVIILMEPRLQLMPCFSFSIPLIPESDLFQCGFSLLPSFRSRCSILPIQVFIYLYRMFKRIYQSFISLFHPPVCPIFNILNK